MFLIPPPSGAPEKEIFFPHIKEKQQSQGLSELAIIFLVVGAWEE